MKKIASILLMVFVLACLVKLYGDRRTPATQPDWREPERMDADWREPEWEDADWREPQREDAGSSITPTSASNEMSAKVNGTTCSFELESAALRNGNMEVSYVCYNPRGEKLYTVKLYLDSNIQPGQYSSDNGSMEFKVTSGLLTAQSGKTGSVLGSTVPVREGVGSFSLDLTYRNDDWTSYAGTFSAVLGRSSLSGTHGDSSMTIENAAFQFTLQ